MRYFYLCLLLVSVGVAVVALGTCGAGSKSSNSLPVNEPSSPTNQLPVAKLSVTPTSGSAPLTVTASTEASTDPDGTIASSRIDFGDGTVSNSRSASHTYIGAGGFIVTATVTDNSGASSDCNGQRGSLLSDWKSAPRGEAVGHSRFGNSAIGSDGLDSGIERSRRYDSEFQN